MPKKLYRSKKDRIIAGVCGGIAEYSNVDSTLIRFLWALITIFSMGFGLIAYLIAIITIPEKP
jgi:phage shock protein PspC (stress-responsive transcriptional regulator)